MKKKNSLFGLILVTLAQTMVAINIVTSKSLLSSLSSFVVLMSRFSLAALILFFLHWWTSTDRRSVHSHFINLTKKDWINIVAQSLTAGVLFNLLMLWGLHYTDANSAGIVTSVLPLIIAIMSWFILGEQFSTRTFISTLMVTLGLIILSFGDYQGGSNTLSGDLLILLSLFPEGLYYILSKLYKIPLPVFLLSALLNGINALFFIGFLPFLSFNYLNWQNEHTFSLLILGLSSGLFYVFWYKGCEQVEGMVASLSTAIMPVTTLILAWVFLGEHFTLLQFLGMGIIISSVLIYLKN
ncbi:DMT family transporter [Legionella sp. km772]|uniref:DMT family transporter n=1 Tax=Legionella sp. km772 TaxID=2498111 RepID=UPI000F8E590D|nr:DMT family transporter [Legionella sp. km772]RUR07321.1 DMT family transporter [Legionella sp. km772]